MRLIKEKFEPSLINLSEYEKNLLLQVEYWKKGRVLEPVAAPPGLYFGKWTEAEDQAMDDNRAAAKEIYEKYKERITELE